jgi:hypothetical protein
MRFFHSKAAKASCPARRPRKSTARQLATSHRGAVPLAAARGAEGPIEIGKGVDVRVEVLTGSSAPA